MKCKRATTAAMRTLKEANPLILCQGTGLIVMLAKQAPERAISFILWWTLGTCLLQLLGVTARVVAILILSRGRKLGSRDFLALVRILLNQQPS